MTRGPCWLHLQHQGRNGPCLFDVESNVAARSSGVTRCWILGTRSQWVTPFCGYVDDNSIRCRLCRSALGVEGEIDTNGVKRTPCLKTNRTAFPIPTFWTQVKQKNIKWQFNISIQVFLVHLNRPTYKLCPFSQPCLHTSAQSAPKPKTASWTLLECF